MASSSRAAVRHERGRVVKANTIQICSSQSGRVDFCRMVSRGTSLRLKFKSEEHRALADEIVERVLRELADKA